MADASGVRLDRKEFRLLLAVLSIAVVVLLYARTWHIPQEADGKYWNGLLAFTILAVACDLYFLPLSRISPARVSSSVVFIPLLATIPLFDHPWPMLISGATAVVAESTLRKPLPRATITRPKRNMSSTVISDTVRRLDKFFFGPDNTRWDLVRVGSALPSGCRKFWFALPGRFVRPVRCITS